MRRYCCLLLEVLVWFLIELTTTYFIFFSGFMDSLDSKFTAISIIVAISIFFGTWRVEQYKKHKQQEDLLHNLIFEIERVVGRHQDWYQGNVPTGRGIPEHDIYRIDIYTYFTKLNPRINGVSTEKLKEDLSYVNDKIALINFYAGQIFQLEIHNSPNQIPQEIKKKYMDKISQTLPDLKKYTTAVKKRCWKILSNFR